MSDNPWAVDEKQFPADDVMRARLEFLVRYAVLAPSTHNTQPWLFWVRNDALELFADRARGLPVVDADGRELTISCGAALAMMDVAARFFGYLPQISLFPDDRNPDLLARLRLSGRYQPGDDELARFFAIRHRRTTRLAFDAHAPSEDDLTHLAGLARHRGVELRLVTEAEDRGAIADIVAEADQKQMADSRFREELADWMHSRRAKSRDGMSDIAMGLPDALSGASALVVRTFDLGGGLAARNRQLAAGSPVLGILASAGDAPLDWMMTGMALTDILLEATARGLCTAYLNQPIEVAETRFRFRRFGVHGVPQLLLRLGHGGQVPHAARRGAHQVICA